MDSIHFPISDNEPIHRGIESDVDPNIVQIGTQDGDHVLGRLVDRKYPSIFTRIDL